MNKFFTIFLVLAVLLAAGCKGRTGSGNESVNIQSSDTGKAVITFSEFEHNFGKVNAGEKVGCIFSFTNSGTKSLIVNSAITSCGCTVPKYDRKPIQPGSGGSIEVVFDTSDRNGIQTKTITITSNAVTPVVLLTIKAEVINNN